MAMLIVCSLPTFILALTCYLVFAEIAKMKRRVTMHAVQRTARLTERETS